MRKITILAFGLLATMTLDAVAQTADDLKCTQCVSTGEIKVNAVTKSRIAPQAVGSSELAPDSVTPSKIREAAVKEEHLSQQVLDLINSARPLQVMAGGESIGAFIDNVDGASYLTLSNMNYFFFVVAVLQPEAPYTRPGELRSEKILFESPNCVGQAYLETDSEGNFQGLSTQQGLVLGVERNPGAYYVAPDEKPAQRSYLSFVSQERFSNCADAILGPYFSVRVFPNVRAITGVLTRTYPAPITLSR
jgi:hypothetical protein